ncbi:MAG: 2OG-Fe(II) oxygenase [Rhizobacter sp.]|nr:2OG-Fe(II) oxygenase [Chlorobiales bacterium]
MMICIDDKWFDDAEVQRQRAYYLAAKPYSHVILDGFLKSDVALSLYQNFPKLSEMKTHYKGVNENKAEDSGFGKHHPLFTAVRDDLMSKEFVKVVERITGISGLIMPDDEMGYGLHQGTDGSFLDVHIDFNIHATKNLHRRLNLLLYLNKHWKTEYGGDLEMWNSTMTACENKVTPLLNRCLIFETADHTYHGYAPIHLPEHESRKSMFGYYYTPLPADLKYHDTTFRARPNEGLLKRVKTDVKEAIKNQIKYRLKQFGLIQFYYDTIFKAKTEK